MTEKFNLQRYYFYYNMGKIQKNIFEQFPWQKVCNRFRLLIIVKNAFTS